jgi:hypothetical protein
MSRLEDTLTAGRFAGRQRIERSVEERAVHAGLEPALQLALGGQAEVRGVLVHRSGAAAELRPSSAAEGGGQGSFLGMPLGYEAGGTPSLGAVDVIHPGRVWINRTLGTGDQADLACLFGGLLLYHPPSTPP